MHLSPFSNVVLLVCLEECATSMIWKGKYYIEAKLLVSTFVAHMGTALRITLTAKHATSLVWIPCIFALHAPPSLLHPFAWMY